MLDSLITSKTRLKLLIKFFVSASNQGHLRGLAEEFQESTNSIRKELNQLSEAGYLEKRTEKNKIVYNANTSHSLFGPLQQLVRKYLHVDEIVDKILDKSGDVHQVMIVGDYAMGIESNQIQIVILGKELNSAYLLQLANTTSLVINKDVTILFEKPESVSQIIIYQKESN